MKTITIKVNDEATEEKVVSLLKEHAPEMLEEEFSVLEYYRTLEKVYTEHNTLKFGYVPGSAVKIMQRLSALLKIWEWKEKNDGAFGWGEVMNGCIQKYFISYECADEKFEIGFLRSYVNTTEIPYFSTQEIANRALKELEAEYKVVFNVK